MNSPWQKGQSGNPKGRPPQIKILRQRCRDMTDEVLEQLINILRNSELDSNRINAAKIILAYGYGLPEAKVTVDDATERPTVGLTRERLLEIASMPVPEDVEPDTEH
jgi:hypothetical protein